jgi:hypothetical protein
MQRKTSKKTVEPAGAFFREITVELIQHYHDNTKKLIKTEEGERVEGKLYRLAKKGEKADTQIMNAETFEVLALIAAPQSAYAEVEAAAAKTGAASILEAEDEHIQEKLAEAAEVATDNTDESNEEPAPATAAPATTDEGTDDMATKKKKTATKKKVAKKAATPAEVASGQSGPKVKITKVNAKEAKVLSQLNHGSDPLKISDIAKCFKGKTKAQANSWVRNSLRRLVRGGLVKQVSRGTYTLTAKGKKFEASA